MTTIPRNAPQQLTEAPTLQWANGRPVARAAGSSDRFAPLVGFHIEAGRDEALDRALTAAALPRIEIRHQRPGGSEVRVHWWLGEGIDFYPLTAGPVATTVAGCLRNGNAARTAQAGIGLRWAEGERSRMAVRGYVGLLLVASYDRPVQLSVRSRMTDVLLSALLDHYRALQAADAIASREVGYHELSLPLGPDAEQEWGKGESATVTPFRSLHEAGELSVDYLRTRWRPRVVEVCAARDWPAAVAWAAAFAQGHAEDALPFDGQAEL